MRQHVDSWRAQQLSDCGILSSFSLLTIVALSGWHHLINAEGDHLAALMAAPGAGTAPFS